MIEKIALTNFKSHAFTEIELGRVTALVGPNGCGKTSFLQATSCLSQLVEQGWETVFRQESDFSNLVRRGRERSVISISGTSMNDLTSTENSWKVSATFSLAAAQPTIDLQLTDDRTTSLLSKGDPLRRILPKFVSLILGNAVFFKPWWRAIASPSYQPEVKPQISIDGSGLASVVANLMTTDDETYKAIEKDLCAIVPSVRRIRARRAKLTLKEKKILSVNEASIPYEEEREVVGHELVFDTADAKEIPAFAMSEGTLCALGLLTLLRNPVAPHLILLDDIEQGLHPLAQRRLINALKMFADEHDRQILLTTHSPYIVDELDAKDVWVMALDQEGVSHAKGLSDHPDAQRAMQVLTTGEFLGAEGEDWVIPENAPIEEAHA
jgi:predicted ATPase